MPSTCETTRSAAEHGSRAEGDALANLEQAVGAAAPPLLAQARVREFDLVVCGGSGIAHYTLRIGPTVLGWQQRAIAYPPADVLASIYGSGSWAQRARRLCRLHREARSCRVPVGVVAAEARAADAYAQLGEAEETIYRISEAAAARHLAAVGWRAKPARKLQADIEKARHPSHVPLHPFQRALAEEVALDRTFSAICSRSERFTRDGGEKTTPNELCRALGLLGRDTGNGQPKRFARVASYPVAEALCEALDMAYEEVGL
jgi:hypothetical protein